jgi:preprotein translocase subunit Sec63
VTSEPKDLDSLPLEVQREWLLKRFTKLAPGASNEQIKKEYFRLCKVLHPDKAGNDPRVRAELSHRMSHLNSTYDKIREIDKDLGEEWPS